MDTGHEGGGQSRGLSLAWEALTCSAPDIPQEAMWNTQSTPSKARCRASASRTSA